MQSERALTREEIEERAARVRKEWTPTERLSRLELPPDSVLWDCFGLQRSSREKSLTPKQQRTDRVHRGQPVDTTARRR